MEIRNVVPLGITKKHYNMWDDSEFKCIALIDTNNNVISLTKKIISYFLTLTDDCVVCFQFFTDIDRDYVRKELVGDIPILEYSPKILILHINNDTKWQHIIDNWGAYDDLKFIFYSGGRIVERTNIETIFQRGKKFIDYLSGNEISVIISDSGDGEEVEIIVQNKLYNNIIEII